MCSQRCHKRLTQRDVSANRTVGVDFQNNNGTVSFKNNASNNGWFFATQSVRFNDELEPLECSSAFSKEICYFEAQFVGGASIGIVSIADGQKHIHGRGSQPAHVGWHGISYGYHSDDGDIYWNDAGAAAIRYQHKSFGPVWENSTVVGCGYNRLRQKLFFTVNGRFIGEPQVEIHQSKYAASVSLHDHGDTAQVNLGSAPFVFDIEAYCSNKKHCVDNSQSIQCRENADIA